MLPHSSGKEKSTFHRRGGPVRYPSRRKSPEPPLMQARFQKVKESELEAMSPASLEYLSRQAKKVSEKAAGKARAKGGANTIANYSGAGPSNTEAGPHRRSKRIAEKGWYDEAKVAADPRPPSTRKAARRELPEDMITPELTLRNIPKVNLLS